MLCTRDAKAGAYARLGTGEPAVVGYIHDGGLLLDLRTVDEVDDEALVEAVERARAERTGA